MAREPIERLTTREQAVLDLLRRGFTNTQIANELAISGNTAKTHVVSVLRKLGVRNRYEALYWPDSAPWWARATILAPIGSFMRRSSIATPVVTGVAGALIVAVVVILGVFVFPLFRANDDVPPDRTGIGDIDQVLDSIEQHDTGQIESRIGLTQRPCEVVDPDIPRPAGIPVIECPQGEPEGTLVDAFWEAACEGAWWYRVGPEDVPEIASRIADWDLALHSVYRGRDDLGDTFVHHDHVAVFGQDDGGTERGIGLFLLNGSIVGTDTDCGLPPTKMVGPSHLTDPILIVE